LETDPDVAALRDGFVVVWTAPSSSVTDIRATILSNTGTTVASNILVNTNTTAAQNEASVVALADGGFVVTWENDLTNLVRAQRFDAVGSKIGAEFTLKNGVSDGFFGDSPEAALLSDGRIAFALGNVVVADHDVMTSIFTVDTRNDFNANGISDIPRARERWHARALADVRLQHGVFRRCGLVQSGTELAGQGQ
jgi:hypothetical protein